MRERLDPIALAGEAGEVEQAGRDAIRICAELGLCRLLVPSAFGGDGLDLRSLCIAREALAAGSGLVDAVFAVQGLGSYPIALSGNQRRWATAICAGSRAARRSRRLR